jgi:hypothetical protein
MAFINPRATPDGWADEGHGQRPTSAAMATEEDA